MSFFMKYHLYFILFIIICLTYYSTKLQKTIIHEINDMKQILNRFENEIENEIESKIESSQNENENDLNENENDLNENDLNENDLNENEIESNQDENEKVIERHMISVKDIIPVMKKKVNPHSKYKLQNKTKTELLRTLQEYNITVPKNSKKSDIIEKLLNL